MSQQGKFSNNNIIGTLTLKSLGQFYFKVTLNLNMSQQGKVSNNDIIEH